MLGTRIGVGILAAVDKVAKLGCVNPIIGDEKMCVGIYIVGGYRPGSIDVSNEVRPMSACERGHI
jgi:hypothetical protein